MPVRLVRKVAFSAGHRYWLPQLSAEENKNLFGKWASPFNHGHNYILEAGFDGDVDPETGMVINIKILDEMLDRKIVDQFDQKSINDEVEHFKQHAASLENLLAFIRDILVSELADLRSSTFDLPSSSIELVSLRLLETPELWSEWTIQNGKEEMTLTRTYEFAASHRLYAHVLSEVRNAELYGKCANPAGHGHNYKFEVTVTGDLDPQTGMMVDLTALDGKVNELVVDRYDHHNLNEDVSEFKGKVTTSEVVAGEIWKALCGHLPAKLVRVRLFETDRSWFEVSG